MEEEKFVVEDDVDEEDNEQEEEELEFAKAKTYEIDESWPDEIKKQVEQINQLAAMMNAEPTIMEVEDDEEDQEETEELEDDSDDDLEEEKLIEIDEADLDSAGEEETEEFNSVF